jgi:tetratricopeptide (TPR) repeat protein
MRSAVAIVMLASLRLAHAQPAGEEPAARLFAEGLALLDAHQPAAACERFAASFKLEANAVGTMLNLGICHEQIGKLATALKWYRRAQARSSEMKLAESEQEAKARAAALAGRVATIAVTTANAPPGAAVRLDGEKLDALDLARIEVDAGPHVLALDAIERKVDIVDGTRTDITLAVPLPKPPVRYEVVDPGAGRRRRALLLAKIGAGTLAASAAFGALGRLAWGSENTQPHRGNWVTAVRWIGTPVGIAGLAAMGYAGVMYLRAPGVRRREIVAPILTPDHAGLVFSTSF